MESVSLFLNRRHFGSSNYARPHWGGHWMLRDLKAPAEILVGSLNTGQLVENTTWPMKATFVSGASRHGIKRMIRLCSGSTCTPLAAAGRQSEKPYGCEPAE